MAVTTAHLLRHLKGRARNTRLRPAKISGEKGANMLDHTAVEPREDVEDHVLQLVATTSDYRVEDVVAVGVARVGLPPDILREVTLELIASGALELKEDYTLRRR